MHSLSNLPWGKIALWGGIAVVGYVIFKTLGSSSGNTADNTGSALVLQSSVPSAAGSVASTASGTGLATTGLMTGDQYASLLGMQSTQAYNLSNNATFAALTQNIYSQLAGGVSVTRGFTQDFTASFDTSSTGPTIHVASNIAPNQPDQDLVDNISNLTSKLAASNANANNIAAQLASAQAASAGYQNKIASLQSQLASLQDRISSAAASTRDASSATGSQRTPNTSAVLATYATILRNLGK